MTSPHSAQRGVSTAGPAQPVETVDVLIVGSGPTGSAYARVLADEAPGARVLMVEAGPQVSSPRGRHVKNITDPEARVAAQTASQGPDRSARDGDPVHSRPPGVMVRPGTYLLGDKASGVPGEDGSADGTVGMPGASLSTNVGGMGAHWTCACPRPGDGERITDIPAAELDTALGRADELLNVTTSAFTDAPFAEEVRKRLGAELDAGRKPERRVRTMPLAVDTWSDGSRHWSGTDVILGDLAEKDTASFELRPDTLCRRLLLEDSAAVGAEMEHLPSGRRTTVRARWVVVACDALRTPQLLFASGIRPTALGRYLNDQPQIVVAVRLDPTILAAARETAAAERPDATFNPVSGVSWVPYDHETHPFHGQVMQLDASPVPLDEEVEPGSIVGLGWFCAKDVRADDRVEFSATEVDGFGMPAMTLHYQLTDVDQERIEAAKTAAARAARLLGTFLDPRGPRRLPSGSSLHYQGTVRMGPADDGTSVCDTYSRVWGTDNVYVAGNGVIPTETACNPTLTSVALAARGAQDIARRYREENAHVS
ncbi:GMC oxidoreductase [Streptomyces mayonensis]|uniref:GMC oxidoreductase n=1 Tax=Streptomyces mayonensis TaxID=2750816 RepID=UPI001C1E29BB|nr:GMC oxidoreductase [Streptomyces sp. A108]MBU6529613.1 GMC family oxidoreductase N-terminal domain-containing protein [Streptomyces sp. A108]